MGRQNHYLELDRTDLHGGHEYRNAVLRNLDVHLVRGGAMREAIIISAILILAVIVWMPKKGGRK